MGAEEVVVSVVVLAVALAIAAMFVGGWWVVAHFIL
jgi:hypothetical protein